MSGRSRRCSARFRWRLCPACEVVGGSGWGCGWGWGVGLGLAGQVWLLTQRRRVLVVAVL